MSAYGAARRKLVAGTEVLRTGGGTSLTVGDCNALLNRLDDLVAGMEAVRDGRWNEGAHGDKDVRMFARLLLNRLSSENAPDEQGFFYAPESPPEVP